MPRRVETSDGLEDLLESSGRDDEGASLPEFVSDPLGVLRRRWILFAVVGVLGLGLTAGMLVFMKREYMATTRVLVTSQQIPEDFVRSTVTEDTVRNLNAMVGTVLSQENLLALLQRFRLFPELEKKQLPQSELLDRLRQLIQVEPLAGISHGEASMIIELRFTHRDAQMAADVANALGALFIDTSLQRRNDLARRTTEFLVQQLERDEKDLREQTQQISDFRQQHRGELPSDLDANLRRLDSLSDRRQYLIGQISQKETQIMTLSAMPSAAAVSQRELLLEDLRRQLATQLAANTEDHPNVIALKERVARQEEVVDEERRARGGSRGSEALIGAEQHSLTGLKAQLAEIEGTTEQLDAQIDRVPAVEEKLTALERKEKVLRDNYVDTLRKVERAKLAESLESDRQGARVTVLDVATRPTRPVRSRMVLLMGGMAATLVASVAFAVLFELLDPVVLTARQLERIAERPVLGSLPRMS